MVWMAYRDILGLVARGITWQLSLPLVGGWGCHPLEENTWDSGIICLCYPLVPVPGDGYNT